jgi:3-oxoacyl-[acyl-carrier protein] reductase
MMAATIERLGRLDILINNASLRHHAPLDALTLEHWHRVTQTILDGAFLCAQAAAPHLSRQKQGIIINIGGASAHVGGSNNLPVMTAKMGIIGFTRALAFELGPQPDGLLVRSDGGGADRVPLSWQHAPKAA